MATKKQFSSFQELLSSSQKLILVDFYATWCGPCQMMASILDQVNTRMSDRVQVVKVDTDNYPDLATNYQVHALPTLVLFKNGQQVDRIEGVLPADQLVARLQPHLG